MWKGARHNGGESGEGKSSTVNALFNMDVAKVGVGVDPETMAITKLKTGFARPCGLVYPTGPNLELKLEEISWVSLAKLLVPR